AEVTRRYTTLMAASQPAVAAEALDAYDFGRHRRLLDVGGGNGAFLRAVGARAPRLDLHLFDLPSVVAEAPGLFAAACMADRAVVHGGSFLSDPLPQGADIATLVRVLHDHDDARALVILRAVRAALPRDGTLLLIEPMAGAPGAEPVGEAYFGFYLLAMGSGRARAPAEIAALLHAAGFDRPRFLPTHTSLITGIAVAQCRDNAL
ncbi:methyltransferase, partial [Acidisphaera rubrifaciens]|uniref:methyltransferase n=1 Tax=Acidisphaera rubrifaciens TaxID=50715 RepID=UPI000662A7AE